jgi:hypothetical protein
MNIEFLIEDYSGGEALEALLPRCLEPGTEYQVRRFSGKQDLLKKLPQRLKGYREWITEDYLIVVLIDRDAEDCVVLKQKLDDIAIQAGFKTKGQDPHSYQVLNRMDKPKAAREIAAHMNPVVNRSKSFQVFYESLRAWQNRKQENDSSFDDHTGSLG